MFKSLYGCLAGTLKPGGFYPVSKCDLFADPKLITIYRIDTGKDGKESDVFDVSSYITGSDISFYRLLRDIFDVILDFEFPPTKKGAEYFKSIYPTEEQVNSVDIPSSLRDAILVRSIEAKIHSKVPENFVVECYSKDGKIIVSYDLVSKGNVYSSVGKQSFDLSSDNIEDLILKEAIKLVSKYYDKLATKAYKEYENTKKRSKSLIEKLSSIKF